MIERLISRELLRLAASFPAVTLTGPRQSGKTTLCRELFRGKPYANLELPDQRRFALDDPRGFLSGFPQGAILDEVQRAPGLLSYLQVDIDQHRRTAGRWILTGSQNLALLESISQTLAGRTAVAHLLPFSLAEVKRAAPARLDLGDHLLRGGFPELQISDVRTADWFHAYFATYVERDVRQIRKIGDLTEFERFVRLAAGRSGQLLNVASLASDAGLRQETAKSWLSVLEAGFVIHRLSSFHGNLSKRLIKRPKLYFTDTGLLCHLLGIQNGEQLRQHPLRGAVFETFVVAELMRQRHHLGLPWRLAFYRDVHGTEVDVVIEDGRRLLIAETKAGGTYHGEMARNARRLRAALPGDIEVRLAVIFGGERDERRSDVSVVPWLELDEAVRALLGR